MRRAFTLVELLVVVAILAIMVTAGVVSLTSGQGAARTRGAARDVVAAIRHARSVALVSQQPATIEFANEPMPEGGTAAHVKINSVRLMSTNAVTRATTLEGEVVDLTGEADEARPAERGKGAPAKGDAPAAAEDAPGEDISDILFSPVSDDVMRGIRLKVLTGDEAAAASGVSSYSTADAPRSRVSVFSTADYINSRYQEKVAAEKAAAAAAKAKEAADEAAAAAPEEEGSGPVSVVWEVNGRTEPHSVWVYRDGTKPEEGLLIRVDRFGAVKVLSGDGREDED